LLYIRNTRIEKLRDVTLCVAVVLTEQFCRTRSVF